MKQNITIRIAKEEFSLEVDAELEEGIRVAVDNVNDSIDNLLSRYGNVDMQKVLSIVLLNEEMKIVDLENRNSRQVNDIMGDIEALDAKLEEYLLSR